MSHALRICLTATATALVAAGLSLGTPAVHADAPSAVDYSCDQTLPLGLPGGLSGLPLSIDALGQVSAPVGGAVGQLETVTGLGDLLAGLGGTVSGLLGTVSGLTFTLGDGVETVTGSFTGTGALQIPALPIPADLAAATDLPLHAPASFDIDLLGGVLGTLTCTLTGASDVVADVLVTAPSGDPGDPGTPGDPGDPGTPGGSGGSGTVPPGGTGTVHPAKVASVVRARLAHRTVARHQRARVAIVVRTVHGKLVHGGKVVVRIDGRQLSARHTVSTRGTASYRLPGVKPGTHRITVRYLGNGSTKASSAARLTLRVRR